VPYYVREVVEKLRFRRARSQDFDRRSGVSQRLASPAWTERLLSERGAPGAQSTAKHPVWRAWPTFYAALPSITGKFEMNTKAS